MRKRTFSIKDICRRKTIKQCYFKVLGILNCGYYKLVSQEPCCWSSLVSWVVLWVVHFKWCFYYFYDVSMSSFNSTVSICTSVWSWLICLTNSAGALSLSSWGWIVFALFLLSKTFLLAIVFFLNYYLNTPWVHPNEINKSH